MSEFRINTNTNGAQLSPAIATLSDGGFVVIWHSDEPEPNSAFFGIYGQRYDANGSKIGEEFKVKSAVDTSNFYPSVAAISSGGFVVSWSSIRENINDNGVYGQIYNASGEKVGNEFFAIPNPSSGQDYNSIVALSGGGFVITGSWSGQDGSGSGIYGQRYDTNGQTVGGRFLVNTVTNSDQNTPSIAALSDGGFVITWDSFEQDGNFYGVYGQRYNTNGQKVGDEFRVNTTTVDNQVNSSVAALSGGGFVVTWESPKAGDDPDIGIYGQRYDANGQTVGGEFRVNTNTTGIQRFAYVTALGDGGFAVTWESNGQDGSSYGVYGQRFDLNGQKVGDEFRVNTNTTGDQGDAAATTLLNGNLVVVWESPGNPAPNERPGDIFGTIFTPSVALSVITIAKGTDATEPSTNGSFVLTRTGGDLSSPLTVNLSTPTGTATSGTDYEAILPTTATFAAGSATATVNVKVIDDTAVEPTETIILGVAAGTGYTLGTTTSATINLTDDDVAPPPPPVLPEISIAGGANAAEPHTPGSFVLTRTGDLTKALTVNLALPTGTATNGKDYQTFPTSVTFAAGSATATLGVKPIADKEVEGVETISLALAVGNGYTIASTANTASIHLCDAIIKGDKKNNTLKGSHGDDKIQGLGGEDKIYAGGGDDCIEGGDGKDTIYGEKGNDTIYGGKGNDVIDGGSGHDRVSGDAGNDTISGGRGNDILLGGKGNDCIDGGDGHDILDGVKAVDSQLVLPLLAKFGKGEIDCLTGGKGKDTFVLGMGEDTELGITTGGSYYVGQKNQDYALIKDYHAKEGDVIQLCGDASDYYLATVKGSLPRGVGIYTNDSRDLVGIIEGASLKHFNLNNSSIFHFVGGDVMP
jgi:Ca2+-binding RTX toxin-like protein